MTLIEKLRTYPATATIFIGSRSNFLWIGKQPDSFSALPEIDRYYVTALEKQLIKTQRSFDTSVGKNHPRDVQRYETKLKKCMKQLDAYIPMRNRKVSETYRRIQDQGIVIKVEGDEQGFYWDYGKKIAQREPRKGKK